MSLQATQIWSICNTPSGESSMYLNFSTRLLCRFVHQFRHYIDTNLVVPIWSKCKPSNLINTLHGILVHAIAWMTCSISSLNDFYPSYDNLTRNTHACINLYQKTYVKVSTQRLLHTCMCLCKAPYYS